MFSIALIRVHLRDYMAIAISFTYRPDQNVNSNQIVEHLEHLYRLLKKAINGAYAL